MAMEDHSLFKINALPSSEGRGLSSPLVLVPHILFVCVCWDGIQGLGLARQALCHRATLQPPSYFQKADKKRDKPR